MASSTPPAHGSLAPVLRLAWPVLVEQLLILLVGLVDMWLCGNYLQAPHLAAIGCISYILWLIPCIFALVGIGAMALTARLVGAREWDEARAVTHQAVMAGFALAALTTAGFAVGGQAFFSFLQLPPEAAALAHRYLQILLPIIPGIMLVQVGNACLRGAGDTLTGFFTMSIVNVVNVIVGVGLVTGWGPFPEAGWDGLAWGTASGYGAGGLAMLVLLLRGRAGLRLTAAGLKIDSDLMRRMFRIGIPGGIDRIAVVSCHLWYLSIINALGTIEAAAHGITIRIESLAYLPGTAFSVAAASLTGRMLGARDPDLAKRYALVSLGTGGAIMLFVGFLMFFAGDVLVDPFLGDRSPEVSSLSVRLLRIAGIVMAPLAVSMILTGALHGAGDTRWPLIFTLTGMAGIRIPIAYWLAWDSVPLPLLGIDIPGCDLGVMGAWYAAVADLFLRGLLVTVRFTHGGWKRIRV